MHLCEICKRGDGISGIIRAFVTLYGFRMHLLNVHSVKHKNRSWWEIHDIHYKVSKRHD